MGYLVVIDCVFLPYDLEVQEVSNIELPAHGCLSDHRLAYELKPAPVCRMQDTLLIPIFILYLQRVLVVVFSLEFNN